MNPGLYRLQSYPFEKLAALLQGITPPDGVTALDLSIGEPKYAMPAIVLDALRDALPRAARYPSTRGGRDLREAISSWLRSRFGLTDAAVDPDRHVLPVNGTREALFAIAQCLLDPAEHAVVMLPNPFYQIYEGAALLAGAEPCYLNCVAENDWLPELDGVPEKVWQRCRLMYLCTPGNPTGTVLPQEYFERLFTLADRYGFVIASDECYSEIYFDESAPPRGLLEAAAKAGRTDHAGCIVFHSLSKRSNVPGLRSGFVAGDEELITAFYRYRTYHGCSMPPFTQQASIAAWGDETHVRENRATYRRAFDSVLEVLEPVLTVTRPQAGFYLWPQLPMDDQSFAHELFARFNVTVLPGSYISRDIGGVNPGKDRARIALVASPDECIQAAQRVRELIGSR